MRKSIESCCPFCHRKCPEHGVITEDVPWAYHNSGFTKSFDKMSCLLCMCMNKSFAPVFRE